MLEQTFHTPLPVTLEVAIPSGDIDVETDGADETALTIDGNEQMLEHIEVRQDGDRVLVTLRDKGKFGISFSGSGFNIGSLVFGSGGLRVRARVPHGANVTIKTASADTKLAGHFGRLELNSASGDVRLRGEVAENVTVKTVSGDVELERVDGDLLVQCVSGDIHARTVSGSVDTKSVSGDIRVEAVTAGDVRFTSVSGDIEIGIAPGSLLDVDAGSTSGDLSSEVPLASEPLAGEDAAGGPTVVLRGRTVSGDVRVFRAG
ncbi:MAG TPA: DUF4097 family beta strand repeat-containing protein [Gaiellaceae bacterium]|nr:DUF4097 family beta strand repeat-containing protein [Gaiellaceae bacterium]